MVIVLLEYVLESALPEAGFKDLSMIDLCNCKKRLTIKGYVNGI